MRTIALFLIILRVSIVFAGQSSNDSSIEKDDTRNFDLSAEYRHDTLETDDAETDFYRFKGAVKCTRTIGAFAAAAWIPDEKRKTYSFAFQTADPSIPISVTGGDFHVQFGSGLSIGHGRPYNPDPFRKEKSSYEENGIKPVISGSQSSAFRGLSLSHAVSDVFSVTLFGSRALRYYAGGDSSSSIGTLMTHPEKDGRNTEPVYLRSAGGLISITFDYTLMTVSSFHADLSTPSGNRILWSSSTENEGYRSSSGGSFYTAYNDGVIRAYADCALSSSEYVKNGKKTRINDKAFQTEAELLKDSFVLHLAAKNTGTRFYSPFSVPIGSRSPSDFFFCETTVSPVESMSLTSDAAVEKTKTVSSFDPEPSSTFREGVTITINPARCMKITTGHRLTGGSLNSFPERQQFCGGLKFDFSGYDQIEMCYIEQRKKGAVSRVFQGQTGIGIARIFTIGLNYAEIRVKSDDNVYLSPLPLDGVMVPWIAVNGRARLASLRLTADWKGLSFHVKGLCLWTGKTIVHRRIEFSSRGTW